ncbi:MULTISPECIES: Crp/Fnr family transcriptional regulator [Pseudoalteromonas]|uniref:Crp/Fnr family transcriptional regulator n=1 Tax=Pseudoalteromonas ruthenica TaxID=151081 RepID=A0A0F4PQT1_9GAMM|nr:MULTISPECIES: Crp/Fnr family transcriptional regulator [Pseudoalteromonas]KJY96611.1 Crp/Fnr family transcriptional regulator [Pseudoalteromonas ruthenica]KJY98482.1 Crp/Fnr family transcriptional regulator [Pseudoalteromonas ruthenica]MCF2862255.1 Crp/Fnr family transcriptional regulator [Pseudoalteromonas sp. CNAT2-18]MCG7544578.1 Crp/Fnr family transcriptional regulator [Pseudoalteromonas sp. MM17-2]MCG7557976.1 Crp/Fnr family transcriptional regulator [Pseudoalteromonas sp. CNAT2-18.1]|tara:strand:- start:1027 stop:1677 length:651 start_codon:yes stop_codon:yes gene_type:complete
MFQYHFSTDLVEQLLHFTGNRYQQQKKEVLLHQDQPLKKLVLVRSGTVSFSYDVGNGRRLLLGQLDCNNTLIGEIEALNNQPCIYTVTCFSDVSYNLIELKHWRQVLLENPQLSLYTAQTIAAKFQENQKVNLDKLLLPLSYNIAKDCLMRAQNNNPTLLRAYPTVSAEAERFATTERAYRRVVTELVDKGLIVRSKEGLQTIDVSALEEFVESFT